jgi:histidyl-tRNA synthetase
MAVMNQLGINKDKRSNLDAFVTVFNQDCLANSLEIATKLREAGLSVEINQTDDKLGRQFKLADKRQAKVAIVLGPDEIKENKVTIKYLQESQGGTKQNQETIDINDLVKKTKSI